MAEIVHNYAQEPQKLSKTKLGYGQFNYRREWMEMLEAEWSKMES